MAEEDVSGWAFRDVLPLPFRIVLLLQLGVHLWYALVWYCFRVHKMNCLALLNLSYSPHKYSSDRQDAAGISGEAATTSAADMSENQVLLNGINGTIARTLTVNVSGLIAYWIPMVMVERDSLVLKYASSVLPLLLLFHTLYMVFADGSTMGQERVSSTLWRILVGNINSATMRTNDILLSDSLTSYAKVLNDLGSFMWMSVFPAASYNPELEATILAYPALVRIKQCWYEYSVTRQRQHLFNLLKYSALLGPVLVNMLIKIKMTQLTETPEAGAQLNGLNFWWYFFSTVSSAYSFLWDVRMDWGFEMFEHLFNRNHGRFTPLRDLSKLVYKNILGYYLVIVIDFVLRFIWVFKVFVIKETEVDLGLKNRVGNFLFGYDFLSFGFFLLELLEILRRWLWCFLKLESDMVKLQDKDDMVHAIPLSSVKMG